MILLKNVRHIDWRTFEITAGNLLVNEGIDEKIQFISPEEIAQLPNDCQQIDCQGKFAIKSLVNAHHHAYSALAPGMPPPIDEPNDFLEILFLFLL